MFADIEDETNSLLENFDWNAQSLFITPLGQEIQRISGRILLGKQENQSEYAKYINSLSGALSTMSQCFWDIDMTIKLMEFARPEIKSFKMTRVDRGDYLRYIMENYFFRLPKLKDVTMQFLNLFYRMGHSQSVGLEKKIRKHPDVISNKLSVYLDYFDFALEKIAPVRHRIAHRGELEDSTLTMLSIYHIVPYDQKTYETLLKSMISYSFLFKQTQREFKKAVIGLLLMLKADFDKISAILLELSNPPALSDLQIRKHTDGDL